MRQTGILLLFILIATGCAYDTRPFMKVSPQVNILLSESSEIKLSGLGHYRLTCAPINESAQGDLSASVSNGLLLLNGVPMQTNTAEIAPSDSFTYQKKNYRGIARILMKDGRLLLVNQLDLESYLYGVLPLEVSPSWDEEALKAQAVVSRTYALYEVMNARKTSKPYDLFDDTRSQVYQGLSVENPVTTRAVETTLGEVVQYHGRVIKAYFHAASGGMTESALEAFGADSPYLKPVDSPYGGEVYPEYRWILTMPLTKVQDLFKLESPIVGVSVTQRTASKRIKQISFTDSDSNRLEISGSDFRTLIGSTRMKSTRANLRITNDQLEISGQGYGHGVGLGQWDALGMAKHGMRYRNVVLFFYPGTKIEKVW